MSCVGSVMSCACSVWSSCVLGFFGKLSTSSLLYLREVMSQPHVQSSQANTWLHRNGSPHSGEGGNGLHGNGSRHSGMVKMVSMETDPVTLEW
uniref:Uncharacterized protein n=1 Tax=Anguilla anguilla TaxID=7936 RepID=A0A0E9XNI5_ANGAN